FAQIDEIIQGRLLEMRPRRTALVWLVFGADHHARSAGGLDVVAHRCGEIERRDPVGRASFDNPARIVGAAKLIAEFRLVTVKRDKLVAAKGPYLFLCGRMRVLGALRLVASHRGNLCVASGVQVGQQAIEPRIANNTQGLLALPAGTLISGGRMIAARITSRHSAPKVCSMVTKPPCSYSHATRPTEAPAAVKPMK